MLTREQLFPFDRDAGRIPLYLRIARRLAVCQLDERDIASMAERHGWNENLDKAQAIAGCYDYPCHVS